MAMSARVLTRSRTARRWLAGGTAAALATLTIPFLAVTPASAALGDTFGPFEVDGDLVAQSVVDWGNVGVSNVVTVNDNFSLSSNQDDTTFKSNSKEYDATASTNGWPNWDTEAANNAADKTDFGRVAIYNKNIPGTPPAQWTYIGFDRGSATGTGKFAVELNQIKSSTPNGNPRRSVGDVRFIVWDQGSGSITLQGDAQNTDVGAYVWSDPDSTTPGFEDVAPYDGSWVKFSNAIAVANFAGAVNSASVAVPSWWTGNNVVNSTVGADQFVEFGFNLTGLGATLGCPSQGFKAWNMRSLTGTGQTGALKDLIKEQPIDIPSTCGTIVLTKESLGGVGLPGAQFTITPDPTPGSDEDSLVVTSGPDGSVTISPAVPGTYSVSETTAPLGYILVPWTHTFTLGDSGTYSYTFRNPLGDITWTKNYQGYTTQQSFPQGFTGQTFTVTRADDAVDMTNAQFATISGITATGCPAACTLTVTDNGARDSDSAWGRIRVNNLPVGSYTVTEPASGAPAGFGVGGGSGTAVVPSFLATAPMDDEDNLINHLAVVTRNGGATTAGTTFDNPRLPARLAVKKVGQPGNVAVEGAVFDLYRVVGTKDANPGTGDDVAVGQVTTGATGVGTSGNLAWGSSYYFVEISVPAPWNLPDNRVTDAVALTAADATAQAGGTAVQILTVNDPRTTITTDAQDATNLPGGTLNDVATVSGIRNDAGGTITFTAYGPFETTDAVGVCTADNLVFTTQSTSIKGSVVGNTVTVTSADFAPEVAGYYYWIASYSGDATTGTLGATGECGDPAEISSVEPATPGISTAADGERTLPSATLYDVATVVGLTPDATGTVTFRLYGPGDATCSAAPVFAPAPIALGPVSEDNGVYFARVTSTTYTANAPGVYRWIASYSGDANNVPVSGACNDANENWRVDKAPTDITTTATATATLPNAQIGDSATITGLTTDASGTVTFRLYGPVTGINPVPTCTAQVGNDLTVSFAKEQVAGNGTITVSSPLVTVNVAGAYYWIASYSGDANNDPAAGACGDTGETTIVSPGQPTIVTTATPTVTLGSGSTGATIFDTATLGNLTPTASGTVTFTVYGPFAADESIVCSPDSLHATRTVTFPAPTPVNGSVAVFTSVPVTEAGTYAWLASYGGDANNKSVSHACGDITPPNQERSVVEPATPSIETLATQSAILGLADEATVNISDTATLTGLTDGATGTVSFSLYGPDDATCATEPLDTVTGVSIAGLVEDGFAEVSSGPVTVSAPGTYRWIATYSGDSDNVGVAGACNDPGESTVVTQGDPGIAKIVESPEGTPVTGSVAVGTVLHYTVTVSNSGTASVTADVIDVLPAGLGAPTGISNGGTYAAGTRTITWPQVTLAGGATLGLEYDAEVLASAAAPGKDTLINDASWFDLHATTTTKVKWLELGVTPICAVEGSHAVEVGYSLRSHNFEYFGASGPFGVTLAWNGGAVAPATVDGAPQGMGTMILSDSSAVKGILYYPGTTVTDGVATDWPGWAYDATTNTWTPADDGLLPSVDLTAASNGVDATVAVTYDDDAACNPPGIPTLVKSSPNEVGSQANLSGNVASGSTIHYVITLTNTGGTTVVSDLVDTLPAGVTPVAGTYTPADPDSEAGQTLTWADVAVAAGQTVTYEFDVTVDAQAAPGDIVDLVNVATWAGLEDTARHVVVGEGAQQDPTLDKSSDPASGSTVSVGDVITYTVKVGNTGNVPITGDLVDTLPDGVEVVGGYTRDDGGKAEPDTATSDALIWKAVTVLPGQVVTFTYEVKVLDSAEGALVNTAEWVGLKDDTTHRVGQPQLPQTGLGMDPLASLLWALVLGGLGVVLLVIGRRREPQQG
ncbi:SpaA isopeptide-forming pilin-related protein [Longivirga aurantiaca]|uniref:SpaA isopeptide-forming pilin-related protein n=1 Tax=Longivirga aurantiaca TaxID=1837743 RepID=A0ABW1T1P6_9ACTN